MTRSKVSGRATSNTKSSEWLIEGDGVFQMSPVCGRYSGEWFNNLPHGEGTLLDSTSGDR